MPTSAGADVLQVAMPLFHVGGMSWALLGLVAAAPPCAILRRPDPVAVLDDLASGITHTFLVPALLAAMVRVPGERTFPELRVVWYGASPMPLPVLRACVALFPGRMAQVYGMTEASGAVTVLPVADHEDPEVAHRLVSAGRPFPGVEIEIRDPATEEPVPVGEPGEIWVRGASLMSGYWGRPEATAATITPDGWLRSGDGGHRDADGYVYVTDRIKDMIISGGENIYPAEIERVLAEHPSVGDCAVIGVPDDAVGRGAEGRGRRGAGPGRRRRGPARPLPHAPRRVQVPEVGGRAGRAPPQPDRQGAEEGPPQAVLARGCLNLKLD